MESERLDVRLDPDRLRRLREMAATYDVPVSEVVRRLIDEHVAGQFDHSYRLWALLILELWQQEWVD